MVVTDLAVPATVEDIKKPLTPDERDEVDKPDFMEPLKMYLEGLNQMPGLTKMQQHPYVQRVRQFATRRTDVRIAVEKNPDILKTVINPVVIVGLPRSGTTLLQRLLASDPKFVSPMFFEVLQPCPPGRPENWKDSEKYRKAKEALEGLAPGGIIEEMQHKHEMKLDVPEECIWIIQTYFMDMALNLFPEMEKWKDYSFNPPRENLKNAYEYYKKALQCIFYEGLKGGKVPLLKAPLHCLFLDMYREVFPDAKFIFPYRNAREMVGSCCSVFSLASTMSRIPCTKEDIKKYTLEFLKLGSSRVVENLKEMPKDSFYTLPYSDLIKDPVNTVKEIYSHFDWKMTGETEEQLQGYMEKNRQHKLGAHKYSLEEYGITDDELKENLAGFFDYFGGMQALL